MFFTLIFQYINKLIKGEVRDFASPEAFHAVKVQCLKDDRIKPLAKICSKFPMPVSALVGDMLIQPCDLTNTPPPAIRTFYLTRKRFVEAAKFGQRLFQELWRLYLFIPKSAPTL